MQILGEMIFGGLSVKGVVGQMHAIEAATGKPLEPAFGGGDGKHVDQACALAEAAFDPYRLPTTL